MNIADPENFFQENDFHGSHMRMVVSQTYHGSNDIVFDVRFEDYWKLDNYFRRNGDFKGRFSRKDGQELRSLHANLRLWFCEVTDFLWWSNKGDSLADRLRTDDLSLINAPIASAQVQRGEGAWSLLITMISNEKFRLQFSHLQISVGTGDSREKSKLSVHTPLLLSMRRRLGFSRHPSITPERAVEIAIAAINAGKGSLECVADVMTGVPQPRLDEYEEFYSIEFRHRDFGVVIDIDNTSGEVIKSDIFGGP